MQELVGQNLDRYQITSLLGEGGMGAVLKARDVTLQRDVAIKVMHPHFAQRADFRERFLQEGRTAARLDHPGIVKVYDFGQAQNHLYIVMEFIPGPNLRKMLQDLTARKQWIPLAEAIQLMRQVCLALDYAHRQGVWHRDIKPDNIMLKPQPSEGLPYQPVITDLGLAKLAEGGMMTVEGTSIGTPSYMSPEQATGGKTDARSDVYSLGVLLYELAVGRLPFQVHTIADAIRCHTQESPPPPRSIRPDLPEGVEKAILKAMEKDPARRFADARALADALAAAVAQEKEGSAALTAVPGAVSVLTQFQASPADDRGPSILDQFPGTPSDLAQDRIQVLRPDGTALAVSMKGRRLTVGREGDNDLVLDQAGVSRHHARIEFDGMKYQVIDLNSTNGTFVADVKLLPGVPEEWKPDKPLRIGGSWLRLERAAAQSVAGIAMARPEGTAVEASILHKSRGAGRVGLSVEPMELNVEPGGSATTSLTILNSGPVVDHFVTTVSGVPPAWVPAVPEPVRLMPGAQQAVMLVLQPPRSPASRAGEYRLSIQVTSQDIPSEVAEVKQTVTVSPYSQFSSELHPQKVRAGRPARVSVTNQGNSQETYAVTWKDRADELSFEPPQATLSVPEGQAAATEFQGVPRQQQLFGREKQHAFSVQVASPQGEVQTHSGELVSSPRFPAWILTVVLALCVLLAAAGALGSKLLGDRSGTPTATTVADIGTAVTSPLTSVVSAATAEAPITGAPPITEVPPGEIQWVEEGDLPFSGDLDGDGHWNDVGVFRPSETVWYYDFNHDGSIDTKEGWGYGTGLPIIGDFNCDQIIDRALFVANDGMWYYKYGLSRKPEDNFGPWGLKGDIPLSGDFDGDHCQNDVAVYRQSNATWYFDFKHDGNTDDRVVRGTDTSLPFAGDFDSNGIVDNIGFFEPSLEMWWYHFGEVAEGGQYPPPFGPWGFGDGLPLSGDFDSDGFMDDVALFRSSDGTWMYDLNHDGVAP